MIQVFIDSDDLKNLDTLFDVVDRSIAMRAELCLQAMLYLSRG